MTRTGFLVFAALALAACVDGPLSDHGSSEEQEPRLSFALRVANETVDEGRVQGIVIAENLGASPGYLAPLNRTLDATAWNLTSGELLSNQNPEQGADPAPFQDEDMLVIQPGSTRSLPFITMQSYEFDRGGSYRVAVDYVYYPSPRDNVTVPVQNEFLIEVEWQAPP